MTSTPRSVKLRKERKEQGKHRREFALTDSEWQKVKDFIQSLREGKK